MKTKSCKFCGKTAPNNMRGYCQTCYKYFVMEGKETYPLPEYGEITYAPNGDAICPFCGKAFRKLGMHFYYAHGLISKEAHKKAGWARNAKATNEDYRELMREKLQDHCVDINLIEKGFNTRYTEGHPGRPRESLSEMTLRELRERGLVSIRKNRREK